jgi:hypothetical protein
VRHVKYSVIRVIFSFSGGVLRSRDTHTRNGAKEEGKNITHTHDRPAGLRPRFFPFSERCSLVHMCATRLTKEVGVRPGGYRVMDG